MSLSIGVLSGKNSTAFVDLKLTYVPECAQVPFGVGDRERDIKTRPEFLNPGRSKIPDANTGNVLSSLPHAFIL